MHIQVLTVSKRNLVWQQHHVNELIINSQAFFIIIEEYLSNHALHMRDFCN